MLDSFMCQKSRLAFGRPKFSCQGKYFPSPGKSRLNCPSRAMSLLLLVRNVPQKLNEVEQVFILVCGSDNSFVVKKASDIDDITGLKQVFHHILWSRVGAWFIFSGLE